MIVASLSDQPPQRLRLAALDIARGCALAGMVVYHFVFDLTLFGILEPGTATSGGWAAFARIVAGSFVCIAGASLYLAHQQGFRAKPFLRRLLVLAAAAGAVSLATFFVSRSSFVYFGILHSIAVSSMLGLAFLRVPAAVTVLAAAAAALAPRYLTSAGFDHPALMWTGLAAHHRPSMDFEPTFPWIAPFLLGLAAAKTLARFGVLNRLRGWPSRSGRAVSWLSFPGRHSLAVYLLHQPVLIGLTYVLTLIVLR